MSYPALEIAVADLAGVQACATWADRLELCTGLSTGGLTPSLGLIEAAVAATLDLADGVQVLIRPREGDFTYTASEVALMVRDIQAAGAAGAAGVVVGALTPTARLDTASLATLVAAASVPVTFHRAFDQILATHDLPAALADLTALRQAGVARVLTSGGKARAIDGLATLTELVASAQGTIQIMAGGGVRAGDIAALVAAGVDAVHLSASRAVSCAVGPGAAPGYRVTDQALVAAARTALDQAKPVAADQ